MTSSLLTIDEPESGEPQVPPTGHQARKLEPRRGQRGGQGRGETAQEGWAHDTVMMMIMMIIMITRPRVDKVKPKVWFKY